MRFPKNFYKVTPLSKTLALALFVALPFIGFVLGMKYQQLLGPTNASQTTNADAPQSDACNLSLNLPSGYHFQNPINSFYGYTHTKSGAVRVCQVILGPNYKNGPEGFTGEQIQINAYPVAKTSLDELTSPPTANFSVKAGLNGYKFTRDSRGGQDEVLVFQKDDSYYQIIWRNQPNNLEKIIKSIAGQI